MLSAGATYAASNVVGLGVGRLVGPLLQNAPGVGVNSALFGNGKIGIWGAPSQYGGILNSSKNALNVGWRNGFGYTYFGVSAPFGHLWFLVGKSLKIKK